MQGIKLIAERSKTIFICLVGLIAAGVLIAAVDVYYFLKDARKLG